MTEDLVYRLRKRAEIRRQIPGRKSVENGERDRLADLLDEAADEIESLRPSLVKRFISGEEIPEPDSWNAGALLNYRSRKDDDEA
jgi:hypothetical protein